MKYFLLISLVYLVSADGCEQKNFWTEVDNLETIAFKTTLSKSLHETSGLIEMDGKMWSFNDSGGAPSLYRFSKKDGKVKQTVKITGAQNQDWEAICKGDKDLFICDIGNNGENREKLKIYQIAQNKIDKDTKKIAYDNLIEFSYPKDHLSYNCEAIAFKSGFLYLFTKNGADKQTNVYRLKIQSEYQEAEFIDQYNVHGLITAADWTDDQLVLLGYQGGQGHFFPFLWHFSGSSVTNIFPKKAKYYNIAQDLQFEAITKVGKEYYVTNENCKGVSQSLWKLSLSPK